ncbi:MAG TPA: hypothetical protein VKG23_16600 [Thermoanaerobaculia bacterium]|nr:hypothetical protein [Thermoanaerobaculia bacterium]
MGRFLTLTLTLAVIAASLFFLAAVGAAASVTGRYRIELRDGRQIETRGYPVARGSVWTFHESDGTLTGVPREMVARIVPADEGAEPEAEVSARAAVAPAAEDDLEEAPAPLEPGDLIELPSTGDGPAAEPKASAAAGGAAPNGGLVNGYGGLPNPYTGNSIYGTGNAYAPGTTGPNMPRVPSSTDLSRALSATTPAGSVTSNGFPTLSTSSPTVIGPDGTPTLSTGASTQFEIGPNGTPVLVGNGAAAPAPMLAPNGTAVLATSGQPGAAGPAIGPNGTPVLAGAGQPGGAAPVIGPNGTPVLAPAGQPGSAAFPALAPNGTPAVPAPGHR